MQTGCKSDSILVVGGGVIGLLSALMLARAGVSVALLERRQVGREASWAGGGIVSPLYPWRYGAGVTALAQWSQDFYPRLGADLFAATEIDAEVHTTGLYWLDLDDELEALDWSSRLPCGLHPVARSALLLRIPGLGMKFSRALYLPGVASVRNPRLVRALRAALEQLPNVMLHEESEVTGLVCEAGQVLGVRTPEGDIYANRVLVAAGAWSSELLATLGLQLPVEPVKGQMILYKCEPDFLPAIVLAKGATRFRARMGTSWSAVRWSMSVLTRRPPRRLWRVSRPLPRSFCRRWLTLKWSATGRGCVPGRRMASRSSERCRSSRGYG